MRRVPGGVAAALAIEVTHHRTAFIATRPVIAGVIICIRKERRAVGHGARQNVVPVRLVAPAKHAIAVLIESRASDDVGAQVQLVNVLSDELTGGIVPGAVADSAARVGSSTIR